MNKEGQIRLSFGVIFSIIIIIAIVGVAFYAISFFIGLSKCNDLGFYYRGLENEVDKAWKSTSYRDTYVGELPSNIESVCFGDLKSSEAREYDEYELLRRYRSSDLNFFIYPFEEACDGNLGINKLENVEVDGFFCTEVRDERVEIILEKRSGDSLVKISG